MDSRRRIQPSKLSQYIKELGLSHKETAKSFIFTCPLCGGKDKLYIRKSDGKFKCFRCATENGFAGYAEYALLELTDLPLESLKDALYGSGQIQSSYLLLVMKDFTGDEDIEEDLEQDTLPSLMWPYHCLPIVHEGAEAGRQYLLGRGVPTEIAEEYQVRYSPEKRAVVFPAYVGEKLVGWQFRTIDPTRYLINNKIQETNKAWSSTDFPSDKTFMFANRLNGVSKAVVCEGPIDAIKCHLFGGNVCVTGKSITARHVSLLVRSGIKQIYAGLDPDAFGEIQPLLTKVGHSAKVYLPELPQSPTGEKTDFGSLSMEEAFAVLQKAKETKKNQLRVWMNPCFLMSHRV